MMAFKSFARTGSLIASIAVAQPALAQELVDLEVCRLSVSADNAIDWRGLYGRGYEVFEPAENYEVVAVQVRHEGPACNFFLSAAPLGGSGSPALEGPQEQLLYDLRRMPDGPSILSPDYFGSEFSRIDGQFGPGAQSQTYQLYLAVPSSQLVGGGTYTGQAVLRVFRDDSDGPALADEAGVAISVPVESVLNVELADAAPGVRTMDVDLGSLSRSMERSVLFEIRSNASVRARIASQNRGTLTHFAGAPGIPYRMMVGEVPVDLSSSNAEIDVTPAKTQQSALPMTIAVDGAEIAAAGQYSDLVTITFIAD
ncbi:hypothetical protein [Pelagerythrobacter sp.]|uniref:hypothetical protein n=1 Tax=Pelagerythrobacter sp. TaxID=2800702 RepID=UPI0035B4665A